MLLRSLKSLVFVSALAVTGVPAAAETHVELPGVEIHVGHHAPPAIRHEHRPPRPASDYVWIPGAWDWQGSDWVWLDGRWERPGYAHARWVAPRYRREGDIWRYEPGHWNHQKLVEGDDYRRWHEEHARNRHDDGNGGDHDRDDRR